MVNEKLKQAFAIHYRAVLEIVFIIFLFYSNLLMGEYNGSGMGNTKGLKWALRDICTQANLLIAVATATVGHFLFDFLRSRFK